MKEEKNNQRTEENHKSSDKQKKTNPHQDQRTRRQAAKSRRRIELKEFHRLSNYLVTFVKLVPKSLSINEEREPKSYEIAKTSNPQPNSLNYNIPNSWRLFYAYILARDSAVAILTKPKRQILLPLRPVMPLIFFNLRPLGLDHSLG